MLADARQFIAPARVAIGARTGIVLLMGCCAVLVLLPVLAVTYPPLLDYPNHLARAYILFNLPHSAILRRAYRDVMRAQPNLAMDLVIPALAHVMSIWAAGRLFVGLTLLAMSGGSVLLHRALHGRWSGWPALSFLFVYNRLFLWGFLGYLFALGGALAAAAAWYAVRERRWQARLSVGTASATLLYLLHLYGLGIYGVIIGGFELGAFLETRRRPVRETLGRWLILGAQFLPAAYLFLFISPTAAAASRIAWGSLASRIAAPLAVINAYHPRLDLAMLALTAAAGLALLAKGKIAVAPAARIPLGLLAALILVMPDELFSSHGADQRIPIALALTAVAAVDWRDASMPLRRLCAGGFLALLALRMLLIGQAWAQAQPVYRQFINAFEQLPEGAKLVSAAPSTGADAPLFHVDAYAVILRDVFLPSLFAAPWDAGSSLGFTPPYAALRAKTPMVVLWPPILARLRDPHDAAAEGPFRPALIKDYDDGLEIDGAAIPRPARLPASCHPIAKGRDFVLVRFPCHAS